MPTASRILGRDVEERVDVASYDTLLAKLLESSFRKRSTRVNNLQASL